jgi:protocatechuate 3,4-dioxygenase, beta subunit
MQEQNKLTRRRMLSMSLASGCYALSSPFSHLFAQQRLRRTPDQILGPFYPLLKPLDQDADLTTVKGRAGHAQGPVIHLAGRVVDLKGKPVAGAQVEIWQANMHGRYTHPIDRNPASLDPNFEGYGVQATDGQGRFRFKTIKPGAYPSQAAGMRTPHIHFQVTADSTRLVTQMYFEGEKLNETDHELQNAVNKELLIAKLLPGTRERGHDSLIANWDIILRS